MSYLILPIVMLLLYEIVARYLFNRPTIWVHETTVIIYAAYIALLGGYTLKHEGHVNVEIIYQLFSPRIRAVINLLTWTLFFAFCGVLLIKGWQEAWEAFKYGETAPTAFAPPLVIAKIMLPLGALLLLFQGIVFYIKNLKVAFTKKETKL